MYRKALEEWRSLKEVGRLGVTLSNLATLYRKTGRFAQAIDTFIEADRYIRDTHGSRSPERVSCLINWSDAYRASGRVAEAAATAAMALSISEEIFDPADARLSHSLHAYAAALQSNGRASETAPLHERALAIRERSYGTAHPYVAATLTALVSLYLEGGRFAEAEPLARRALEIWEARLGAEHANTAIALNNLAQVFRLQDRGVEAEPLYRRSVAILTKANSPEAAKPLTNLGDFHLDRGRNTAALAYYREAERIARNVFGSEAAQTIAAQNKIAKAYEAMGRITEAARLRKEGNAAMAATIAPASDAGR
jgi:tetratricopeptide (TPR) repeat protein